MLVFSSGILSALLINDGAGSFTDSSQALGTSDTISISLGDIDGDDFLAWQRDPSLGSLSDWQTSYGGAPTQGAYARHPLSVLQLIPPHLHQA